jgi:ABC-2 type transport system ATP-binding protein
MHGFLYRDISFSYRRKGQGELAVLERLTWHVPTGVTALLGINGAGKSTLLSLGATALIPRSGEVSLDGLDSRDEQTQFRARVAWMPQHYRAVPGLTVREQVAYSGWLKGMSRDDAWRGASEALARVALQDLADRPASELSGGQQRRVGLASALVHDAEVLLLDEPTSGLDPEQRAMFRELLVNIGADRTVVVSTHDTGEITTAYSHVAVLHEGNVAFDGALQDFSARAPAGSERPIESAFLALISGGR